MSNKELTVGVKFRALRGTPSGDVTVGKEYEVAGLCEDGLPYFIDDAGDINHSIAKGNAFGDGCLYPDGFEVI